MLVVILDIMVGHPGILAQTTNLFSSEISKPQAASGYMVSDNMGHAGNINSTVAQPQQCTSPFQSMSRQTVQRTQPQQSMQPVQLSQQMRQASPQVTAPPPPQYSPITTSAGITSVAGIPYVAIDNRANTIDGSNNQVSLKPAIHGTVQVDQPSQINQVSASISTMPSTGNTQIGNMSNQSLT